MLFKTPAMEAQFRDAHPELQTAVADVDERVTSWGFPPICVTDVFRTKAENVATYMAKNLRQGMDPHEARKDAELRRTFHFCGAAADFRSSGAPYTTEQEAKIFSFLRAAFPATGWETLLHNVSTGVHFHLAIKDWDRLHEWEKQQRALS